jgi:hypothetical protein
MINIVLVLALILFSGAFCWIIRRIGQKRIQQLEQSLHNLSDMVSQLAEIQTKAIQKSTSRLEEIDERIMDLSVPSQDVTLPVEKRRQVIALARQGMSLRDIAKRLKAPMGEAELILNLSRFPGGALRSSFPNNEQVNSHA